MSRMLQGKVALIAGASQGGTGTGCAVRLAAEGANVAICARTVEKMQETIQEVEAVGGTGVMFECDLSDPDGGRDRLIARTEEAFGSIDYLVYVAALGTYAKFETLSLDKLQKGLEVNLKAAWLLNQQVVESLRARNARGAIVNIGTRAARPLEGPPFPDTVVAQTGTLYGSTKAALHRFSQGVAAETYEQGISVNVLSPLAAIATPTVVAGGWIPPEVCEPVETMVEATVALLTGDPRVLTGLDVYSIELLNQLGRPVYDLAGENLVEGWQPADLPAYIKARTNSDPLGSPHARN